MKNWSIALMALLAIACGGNDKNDTAKNDGYFVVEGNIENGRGSVIRLARVAQQTEIVATDTADKDGNFRLEGFAREKFIAVFNFDINKKIFLVVDTTDHIKLKIPDQNYDYYEVSGSAESQTFRNLRDIEVRSGKELAVLRERAEGVDPNNEAVMNGLRAEFQEVNQKYVDEYMDSLQHIESPLIHLYYYYVLQVPFDDTLKARLYDNAVKSGLQAEIVQGFIRQYRSEMATAVGQTAPELNLLDTTGKPVALSSLRGKVVLIDFWASWCGPCRQENPNVKRLYDQYRGKGFEIYGVSLDEKKEDWTQAIHQDGIHWVHVSDLQKWNSAAARLYAVSSIPATFLIDREGKILAKNLRGEELEKKLKQVLK